MYILNLKTSKWLERHHDLIEVTWGWVLTEWLDQTSNLLVISPALYIHNSTPRTVQQSVWGLMGHLHWNPINGINTWQQLLRFHGNYKQESEWVCEIECRLDSQVWTAEDFSSAPSYSITVDRIFSPIINIPAISVKQKTPSSICFSFSHSR